MHHVFVISYYPRFLCCFIKKTLKGTKLDLNNGACKWLIYSHLGSATMYSNYDIIDRLGRGKRVLLHIRILFHLWGKIIAHISRLLL